MDDVNEALNNQYPDWHRADARILGQMLAAQNILFVLPDEKRIAEYFSQAFSQVPGIASNFVCLGNQPVPPGVSYEACKECSTLRKKGNGSLVMPPDFRCGMAAQENTRVIALKTNDHTFGFFVFQPDSTGAFEPYWPFLSNLANYVALSLENRVQKHLLEKSRDEMEDRVKERTEELKQMNERFHLATNAGRLGVWDWDIQKNELVWDEGMYALYGIKKGDFAGAYEAWLNGLHPDDRSRSDEISKLAQLGELEYDTEFRVVWPDGSIHYLKAYGQIVRDSGGRPLRMTGVNFDITERKLADEALQKSEQEFRTLAENSPDVIVRYDRQGHRIYVNPEFERVNHLSAQEAQGKTPVELSTELAPMANEFTEKLLAAMESGTVTKVDLIWTKDGKPMCWYVRIVPEYDANGRVESALTIWSDISERKQVEAALAKTTDQLNEAQRIAHIGSWELDVVNNKLSWSDEIFRMFEIDPKKFGATYEAFLNAIHPDDRDEVNLAYTNSLTTKMPYTIGHRLLYPDGRIKYVHEECETIFDENDNPIRSIGIVQDITERKLAEDAMFFVAQRGWQTGAENFFDALAKFLGEKLDMDYVFIDKLDENPDMAETVALYAKGVIISNMSYPIKGTPCENVIGRRLCIYRQGIQQTFPEDPLLPGMNAESYVGIPLWDSKGRPIGLIAVISCKPLPDNSPVTQLLQLVATRAAAELERKRAEEEIRKLNHELEQRVFDRTAQLEAANKELEAFAYSVSHDLRAPLRHIDGFMEILQSKIGATLDDQGRHYMDIISDSAKHMGTLIDDLLSFSRMGRSEMSKMQVNIEKLVQEVIREFSLETEGRTVLWQISDLPIITGDRAMLRIVFVNLISNALKFTRKREPAEIEIGFTKDQETGTVIFVRDNGVGFDQNYANKLFGVFQRLHRADEFEGTGIGLANVRRIIARHGGRTWAEGEIGKGATFYFTIP